MNTSVKLLVLLGTLFFFSNQAICQTPTPTQTQAIHNMTDLNLDGVTNSLDLILFVNAWNDRSLVNPTLTPTPTLLPTMTETPITPSVELLTLPSGSFLMGNTGNFHDLYYCMCDGCTCEFPRHEVNIGYSFQMGKYEITNAQYADLLNWAKAQGYLNSSAGASYSGGDVYHGGQRLIILDSPQSDIEFITPSFTPKTRNNESMAWHPVHEVSWYGAVAFCNWLSEKEGQVQAYSLAGWSLVNRQGGGYRLPSEAEWEYACRGSAANDKRYSPFWFGDDPELELFSCAYSSIFDQNMVWCANANAWSEEVGKKQPNDYGLYDMHGNVFEWCEDWWHESYTGAPVDGSPWEVPFGFPPVKVYRGGDWIGEASSARSSFRTWTPPTWKGAAVGFRLARSL